MLCSIEIFSRTKNHRTLNLSFVYLDASQIKISILLFSLIKRKQIQADVCVGKGRGIRFDLSTKEMVRSRRESQIINNRTLRSRVNN